MNARFAGAVAEAKMGLLLNRVYLYHAEIADPDIVVTHPITVHLSFTKPERALSGLEVMSYKG